MSKVIIAYERMMPTVSGIKSGFERLSNLYGFSILVKQVLSVTTEDIDSSDVLLLVRPDNIYSARLAEKSGKAGLLVITFCDDDLLNLDRASLPTIPWRRRALIKTLGLSDVIMSPSVYILDKYLPLIAGKRKVLSHTAVSEDEFAPLDKNSSTVKIVYAAGAGHVSLFDKFVRDAFNRIAEEYAGKLSITFVGLKPDFKDFEDKVKTIYKPGMPLKEYREYMAEEKFDLGLAPLNSDDFSKCKYFNKYLEYTMSGVVGLYSNVEPYTYVIDHKINGFLVDDDKWYDVLKEAIDNADLRRKCILNARDHVKNNFQIDGIASKLKSDVPEIFDGVTEKVQCDSFCLYKFEYYVYRLLDYVYLIGYYLKLGGFSLFFDKFFTHIRESGARK